MPPREARSATFPVLWAAFFVAGLLVAAAALVPAFPCPSCVDLDISVFGGCEICRPKRPGDRRITLWRRRQGIRVLEAEGCRRLPLWPSGVP